MELESLCHDANCFVTLTYSDENLPRDPETHTEPCLCKKDVQDYIKRLRHDTPAFRYYVTGEYGDHTLRPHYHLCFFGLGPETYNSIIGKWTIDNTPIGHVHIGEFNRTTANYTVGYTVKKMTSKYDSRLKGRTPEFGGSSLRPGLGAPAMEVIINTLYENNHAYQELLTTQDVPSLIKVGNRTIFLDRYLRNKIREGIGMPENWNQDAKQALSDQTDHPLSAMQRDANFTKKTTELYTTKKEIYQKLTIQNIRKIKKKIQITQSGKTL